VHRKRDGGVARDSQRATDNANAQRVEYTPDDVRILNELAVVVERQHIEQVHAFAPGHHERA
jgi:hypothetical protein